MTQYDDETLTKVRNALANAGLEGQGITDAISNMQNLGILFRERMKGGTMTTQTVKLKNRGTMTEIEINGLDVSRVVYGYTLRQEAGQHPTMELDLIVRQVGYEGAARIELSAELRAALIALGWTAPPE